MQNIDKNRDEYWQHIYRETTKKTKDWEYEKEYRLIIDSFLNDSLPNEERIYRYRFSDLHGIIFGINTSEKDKIKIAKIVKEKCKTEGRKDFVFYQAYFCQVNKNIQHIPISIAKV
ncbi:hypothetical protein BKN38_07805 [Helicobacter sp. CLO-3]|uniref:hypothetical protein n=1 Tax=unclassified Helicobacter TaxID=2593540 RepID=UPI000805C412|nr:MULTISPECIES: hypothetical protein [unclassified Helicobacter]OBV28817.1 hypothetical protein BA723_08090 [Helicobacter sp. CLO-3]OHU82047.1 hypothetical protein BKN38_07805 [Helicobacter sp. CLO-3]